MEIYHEKKSEEPKKKKKRTKPFVVAGPKKEIEKDFSEVEDISLEFFSSVLKVLGGLTFIWMNYELFMLVVPGMSETMGVSNGFAILPGLLSMINFWILYNLIFNTGGGRRQRYFFRAEPFIFAIIGYVGASFTLNYMNQELGLGLSNQLIGLLPIAVAVLFYTTKK